MSTPKRQLQAPLPSHPWNAGHPSPRRNHCGRPPRLSFVTERSPPLPQPPELARPSSLSARRRCAVPASRKIFSSASTFVRWGEIRFVLPLDDVSFGLRSPKLERVSSGTPRYASGPFSSSIPMEGRIHRTRPQAKPETRRATPSDVQASPAGLFDFPRTGPPHPRPLIPRRRHSLLLGCGYWIFAFQIGSQEVRERNPLLRGEGTWHLQSCHTFCPSCTIAAPAAIHGGLRSGFRTC